MKETDADKLVKVLLKWENESYEALRKEIIQEMGYFRSVQQIAFGRICRRNWR